MQLAATIIAAALAVLPREPWPVDYVDAIEVNTVRDRDGQRRFTQCLWLHLGGPNEIVDWRFYGPEMLPVNGWSLFRDKGRLRAVRVLTRRVLYSETPKDPEVERRTMQPLMWRQRLMHNAP